MRNNNLCMKIPLVKKQMCGQLTDFVNGAISDFGKSPSLIYLLVK